MKSIVLAAVAALIAAGASAATITANTTLPASSPAQPVPFASTGGFLQNQTGSVSGVYRDVWEGTSLANTGLYNSVQGGGSAVYDFGGDRSVFSMTWGSPDSYNKLTFLDNGGSVFEIFGNNSAIVPPGTPGLGFVNIVVTGLTFDQVRLDSTTNAFEHALVAAPVPLPAAAWLLLGGLGGLGALSRRRKA